MAALSKTLMAMAKAIPGETLAKLKPSEIKPVSERTIAISLSAPGADGTNRIKVTFENGKYMVRGYRVEETEIFYDLPCANVHDIIESMAGLGNQKAL
jgi:hypothetical protein